MNDPERLLTSDVSEREQRLLRAGASEEPPADGAARLAIALGVAPSSLGRPEVISTSAARSVTRQPAPAGAAAGSSAAKWLALAGAGAIALAGTALVVQRTQLARTPTTPAGEPGEAVEARARDTVQSAPAKTEGPSAATRASAPSQVVRSIADEIAQLERVRVLLSQRDADGSLQLLAAYARDYEQGALREEAHFMRVQALALSGQRVDARRSARSFERLYPKSVHSARVRAIAESLGER